MKTPLCNSDNFNAQKIVKAVNNSDRFTNPLLNPVASQVYAKQRKAPYPCAIDINLQTNRTEVVNAFSQCLNNEVIMWRKITAAGGLDSICLKSKDAAIYDRAPWLFQPPSGLKVARISQGLKMSNIVAATDTEVLSITVPLGYDGVINGVLNTFTGSGYINGSGWLQWRVGINRRWAKDLGEVETFRGSLTGSNSSCEAIRVRSGQVIKYYVNAPAATYGFLDPDGYVICGLFGWWYPVA